jgi:hypothetical protein
MKNFLALSKDQTCVENKSKKFKSLVHKFQGWKNSTKPKMIFFQNLAKILLTKSLDRIRLSCPQVIN